MITDKIGLQLHEMATTGKPLTPKQKEQLEAWYAQQDSAEHYPVKKVKTTADELRGQIESALAQMNKVTKRIQKIAAENKAIRLENQAMKTQLAQALGRQTA